MWVRVGYFEGKVLDGAEERFIGAINEIIVPGIAACPGVLGVKALWPCKFEDRDDRLACQLVVELAKEEDIATMLASPERDAMRERLVSEVLPLFDGRISHINFETA